MAREILKNKKKLIHRIVATTVLLTMIVVMSGCGGGSSSLVGKWKSDDPILAFTTIEFFKDGKCIIADSSSRTWKTIDSTRLEIVDGVGFTILCTYEVSNSGKTLTLGYNSKDYIYTKD